MPLECSSTVVCQAQPGTRSSFLAQLRITKEHTLERTPNLQKTALANENLNRLQFFRLSDP